jgi:hypothetical protein
MGPRTRVIRRAVVTAVLAGAMTLAAEAQAQEPTLTTRPLEVRPVVSGLELPIGVAFLGHDDFLVLEKATGRVKRVLTRRSTRRSVRAQPSYSSGASEEHAGDEPPAAPDTAGPIARGVWLLRPHGLFLSAVALLHGARLRQGQRHEAQGSFRTNAPPPAPPPTQRRGRTGEPSAALGWRRKRCSARVAWGVSSR